MQHQGRMGNAERNTAKSRGQSRLLCSASRVPFLGLGLLVGGIGPAGVRPLPVLMPYDFRPVLGLEMGAR